MSDNKETCPSCGTRTSEVFHTFRNEDRCPCCGLSAGAAAEITAARKSFFEAQAKEQIEALLVRCGRAEAEAETLRSKLEDLVGRLKYVVDEAESDV